MLLCAQYVIPISDDPIENGAVCVRDGKIVDVGPAQMLRLRYPEEEVRDFGMAAITPGFIDLHSRIEDAVLRGLIPDLPYAPWRKRLTELRALLKPEEQYASAYLGGLESISAGITTVADITATGADVRAVNELGLRGVMYYEAAAIEKDLVDYAVKKAWSAVERLSGEVDSERITLGLAPAQVFRCHPKLYRKVTDMAVAHDVPVAIRVAASPEESRFVRFGVAVEASQRIPTEGYMNMPPWLPAGVSPVNYVLNWGGFDADKVIALHCVQVEDEDITKLKENNVGIAVCPSWSAELGMGIAPVSEFLRAGMNVGLGTGAPAAFDFVGMFREMRVVMMTQRALNRETFLTAPTLLELTTLGAARVLHMEDQIGSLEAGKNADIAVVDLSGSHLTPTDNPASAVLSSSGADGILMTMVGGKILFENGKWQGETDVAKTVAQVLETRSRLRTNQA